MKTKMSKKKHEFLILKKICYIKQKCMYCKILKILVNKIHTIIHKNNFS